jgi:hypothetical protein
MPHYKLDSKMRFNSFRYICCLGFIFSPGALFQASGKVYSGRRFTNSTLCGGINKSFALRSARSGFRSILVIHVLAKEGGSNLKWKLCMNFIFENWINFSTGRIFCCLKRGAVWALYVALHYITFRVGSVNLDKILNLVISW